MKIYKLSNALFIFIFIFYFKVLPYKLNGKVVIKILIVGSSQYKPQVQQNVQTWIKLPDPSAERWIKLFFYNLGFHFILTFHITGLCSVNLLTVSRILIINYELIILFLSKWFFIINKFFKADFNCVWERY